jgi:hypothetical protein
MGNLAKNQWFLGCAEIRLPMESIKEDIRINQTSKVKWARSDLTLVHYVFIAFLRADFKAFAMCSL